MWVRQAGGWMDRWVMNWLGRWLLPFVEDGQGLEEARWEGGWAGENLLHTGQPASVNWGGGI